MNQGYDMSESADGITSAYLPTQEEIVTVLSNEESRKELAITLATQLFMDEHGVPKSVSELQALGHMCIEDYTNLTKTYDYFQTHGEFANSPDGIIVNDIHVLISGVQAMRKQNG
jgi:hypothetical protein